MTSTLQTVTDILKPQLYLFISLVMFSYMWGLARLLAARLFSVNIELCVIGIGPSVWQTRRGSTTYRIGLAPFGLQIFIAGLNRGSENRQRSPSVATWRCAIVLLAAPLGVLFFSGALLSRYYMLIGEKSYAIRVVKVVDGMAADTAGIQDGDVIIAVNKIPLKSVNKFVNIIHESDGKPLQLEIVRNSQHKFFVIKPINLQSTWQIGVQVNSGPFRNPLKTWPAIRRGFTQLFSPFIQIYDMVFKSLSPLDLNDLEIVSEDVLPIDIDVFEPSVSAIAMLGFFSLLPLPGLTGWRLLGLGWSLLFKNSNRKGVELRICKIGIQVLLLIIGILLLAEPFFRTRPK